MLGHIYGIIMYIDDRTQAALNTLKDIGLADEPGAFAKRVHSCVVRLLKEFFSQTHTPFSSEFALGLFDRLARGKPISADFMAEQKNRLEAVASEQQADFSEDEEEDAWLSDRYGISPEQAGVVVSLTRKEKRAGQTDNERLQQWKDAYGFDSGKPTLPRIQFMDNYGAAPSLAPVDEVKNEGETPETKEEKKDMCLPNTDIVRAVRAVVEGFCDDLTPFTSVDVSNSVKRAGHQTGNPVRHREVAPIVRELYSDGELDKFGYSRELIKVSLPGDRQAQAWLYHHQTSDPADYDTRSQVALSPKQQQAVKTKKPTHTPPPLPITTVPVAPAIVPTIGAPQGSIGTPRGSRMLNTASQQRTQKGDGRLEIPSAWIRQLGWAEGDDIGAVKDGDAIILKPIGDVTAVEEILYKFKIDRWNRIRVTNRALNKVNRNLGRGGQHIVTIQTNSIKVC